MGRSLDSSSGPSWKSSRICVAKCGAGSCTGDARHRTHGEIMDVAGSWYNELGSQMDIDVEDDGSLTGQYWTAVGDAAGRYPIVGWAEPAAGLTGSTAVGWVVLWRNAGRNSHSVTTWSGQYQIINSEEHILALWILAAETSPDDDWKSMIVGADTFQRTQASTAQMAVRQARGPASHPPGVRPERYRADGC
jgi:Avidin family